MMKSKIHRASVTARVIDASDCILLDRRLMELAGLAQYEQVQVVDIDNGERFESYVEGGEPGVLAVCGSAARRVEERDLVIVISYAQYEDAALVEYQPTVVHVDSGNQPLRTVSNPPGWNQ